MAGINLQDLGSGKFALSKGAIFYTDDAWDFDSDLSADLTFLGFTEGEITFAVNETFQTLTIDENTGDLPHEGFVQGEAPVLTIPIFTGDPDLRAILSPTGSSAGGFDRQVPVKTRTVVVFPEALFLDESGQTTMTLEYDSTGQVWELDGTTVTDEQQRLIEQSLWCWRGFFSKPDVVYRHANAGKSVDEVTFTCMFSYDAPAGSRAYYIGDPTEIDVDINVGYLGS
jgi:hypothetical protein